MDDLNKNITSAAAAKTSKSNKIVLITGGAGFIGSNLVRYFLTEYPDCKIINFDKLTYAGNLQNLADIENNASYIFVKGNTANSKDVKNVFESFKPDFVINCAAESHVDRGLVNPDIFIQSNILGTQVLLDFAREHKVAKFVQISTDEVYGISAKNQPATENSNLNPNNLYAASKAAADLLVRVMQHTYGLNTNIIRSCNNYGPFQFPEKLIPLMICNTLIDDDLPVYGDGKQIREWINVRDHCRAIDLVLHHGKSGEIYNAGTGISRMNLDLVHSILAEFPESKAKVKYVNDRPGHDFSYALDSAKIHKELGWEAEVQFAEGLSETICWYRRNKAWIDNIRSGKYQNYYQEKYESEITE